MRKSRKEVKMTKVDIVLKRMTQGLCPICCAEFRPEWKDKFKAVQYKGKTVYICKGHYVQGEAA